MQSHYGCDLGAGALTRELSQRLSSSAICAHYSRIVIDCNRQLDDESLFLPRADGAAVAANRSLTANDRQNRIDSIYVPFHVEVESRLAAMAEQHRSLLYVAIHSFTPQLAGVARPWDAGVMWDIDDRVALGVADALDAGGALHIGRNEPYSGQAVQDFSVDFHAERQGFANISIEVRQDHLLTSEGIAFWADCLAEALQPYVASPPARLVGFETHEFMTEPSTFVAMANRWGVQRAS